LLIRRPTFDDNDDHSTCNVVYDYIEKAFSWTYAIICNGKSNIHFALACYYSMWMNLPHKHIDNLEFILPDFQKDSY